MNFMVYRVSLVVALLFFTFIMGGCGDPKVSKARHLEQGKVYLEQKNYDKARVEFKNVLQIDPKVAEAYYLLGRVEEQYEEWRAALGYYARAIELDSGLLDARIRLGRFYLLYAVGLKAKDNTGAEAGILEKVKNEIAAVLQQDSEYVDALVLNASLLAHQGEMEAAIAQVQEVLDKHPENEDAILLAARFLVQRKQDDEAREVLEAGIEAIPDTIELRLELTKLHSRNKDLARAITLMQEVVRIDPGNFGYRASLAAYYFQQGDEDKGDRVFREAIKVAPDDTTRYVAYSRSLGKRKGLDAAIEFLETATGNMPDNHELQFSLAVSCREAGRHERAISLYENIIGRWGVEPAGIRARKELAAVYFSRGNEVKSRQFVDEVLAENPGDNDALTIKGKLAVREQDYDMAIASFRAALKYQPDSMELIHLLAESYVRKGDVSLAADTFKRATEIDLDDLDARLKLARFQLAAGQIDLALKQVEIVLAKQPDDLTALIIKSEALMQQHNMPGVIKVVKTMKEAAPDDAEGWFRMGRIYKLQKNNELAQQEFITALEKAPDSESLLAELVDLEIEMGEFSAVEQRLENILQEQPEHPSADKFLGMVYMADKDYENAEKAFQLHLGKSPEDVPVYLQAARACYNLGRRDDAAAYYRQGLLHDGANVELKSGLAGVYERQGEFDGAIKLYNDILAVNPDNAVAANNLAVILVNRKGDQQSLIRAKQLVQGVGVEKHPALLDTLGWAHYKLGEYDQASSVLGQAVEKAPRVPVFHYHLGMAYHKSGDDLLAQQHLQKALAIGKFPGMSEAQETLKVIQ